MNKNILKSIKKKLRPSKPAKKQAPSEEAMLVEQANKLIQQGEYEHAQTLCAKALSLSPRLNSAHRTMAKAMMPGDDYRKILKRIHETLKPRSYAEIGVFKGGALVLAGKSTETVAIDPRPQIDRDIPSRARVFPTYSDDFFARHNLLEELGTEELDLAFIDGLHLFEQVLRDFANIERYSNSKTVVLLHDVYPATALSAERERVTGYWPGDTWKIIPCLKELRPDLKIGVVPTYPAGLGIITGLDRNNTSLQDNHEDIAAKYSQLSFERLATDRAGTLGVIENSWQAVEEFLPVQG